VKGSRPGDCFQQLSFLKKDGIQIAEVKLGSVTQYGPETMLADDEEIIGIFGTKNATDFVTNLGFIIWKPPRL
jgi:hypothetical protein